MKYCTKKIFVQFFHTLNFCLYEKPLPWNVQNSQCQNEHLYHFHWAISVLDDDTFFVEQMSTFERVFSCRSSKIGFGTIIFSHYIWRINFISEILLNFLKEEMLSLCHHCAWYTVHTYYLPLFWHMFFLQFFWTFESIRFEISLQCNVLLCQFKS